MPDRQGKRTWTVIVIDSFHAFDESEDYYIRGFPTLELAVEYARRFNRDRIEEFRKAGSPDDVRDGWRSLGECAVVQIEGGPNITFEDELPFFYANPATPEERDYKAVAKLAGIG